MTALCRIDEAAKELGVPAQSLRTAAERHGFLATSAETIQKVYGHHSPEFQATALKAVERG